MTTTAISETEIIPLSKRRKLLRRFRGQYGITLDEFGQRTELSKAMLSLFENGERDLSPEAWTRVLATMSSLITRDNARRLAEVEQAKKTAEKLGAWSNDPNVLRDYVFPPGSLFNSLKSDEQIAKEKAEVEAERIRLEKSGEIIALIGMELDREAQELLGTTETGEALQKKLTEHIANEIAPKLFQYAKELEQERDQLKGRVAELEQELRALKGE